jgi:aspartyl-tRNA synthetase
MMLILGAENIRDVIAFPKTQKARDLLFDTPAPIEAAHMRELHIRSR